MKTKEQKELTNKVNELERKVRLLEQVSRKQTLTTSIILSIIEEKKVTCDEADKEAPDPEPEPQKERKIVFDWLINQEGKVVVPYSNPNEFDRIEERFKLGDKFYLFSAHYSQGASVKIYIGHYE
jgi:hypothetical protein